MNTREIIETLKSHNIHPNKKLGQNFICNKAIIERIIRDSSINKKDTILEIGPGLGILTESLAEKAKRTIAIEIDSGLTNFLSEQFKNRKNLEIIHADFLKIDLNNRFTKAVSNLPYYCSSEILFRIALKYNVPEVYIMLQKEMADRITSKPGTKNYGALTVTLGLYYEPRILFKIDKRSFYPKPDVASCFMQLKNRNNLELDSEERDLFHDLVKSAFWGRRKTIIKALTESPHLQFDKAFLQNLLKEANIDEMTRGENLAIEDYKLLARKICTHLQNS